jgi:hypothetical protein
MKNFFPKALGRIGLHGSLWLSMLIALLVASALAAQTSGAALFDEVWQTINDAYYDPAFGRKRRRLRPRAKRIR